MNGIIWTPGKFNRLGLAEKGKNKHWSAEKREKFKRMWLSSLPASHIAQEMHIALHATYRARRRMNLPYRKEIAESRVVTLP